MKMMSIDSTATENVIMFRVKVERPSQIFVVNIILENFIQKKF